MKPIANKFIENQHRNLDELNKVLIELGIENDVIDYLLSGIGKDTYNIETQVIAPMQEQILKENECYHKCDNANAHYNIGNARAEFMICEQKCLDQLTWYQPPKELKDE